MGKRYESHITWDKTDAGMVRELSRRFTGWKFSQIDGDPVLGDRTFCYLSAHDDIRASLEACMFQVRDYARAIELPPIRCKIEEILFDERY